MENDLSSFPLKIRLVSTGQEMICKTDREVPRGVSFRVIALRVGTEKRCQVLDEFPDVDKVPMEATEIIRQATTTRIFDMP